MVIFIYIFINIFVKKHFDVITLVIINKLNSIFQTYVLFVAVYMCLSTHMLLSEIPLTKYNINIVATNNPG